MNKEERFVRINDRIKFSPVMVVKDGQNLGSMPVEEAKRLAREAELDLVEIVPDARPPICRIMDYGKYRYEQSIKEKVARKNQKTSQLKEVRLRPNTGDHDIKTKVKAIRNFIEDGDKVQIKIEYKKREIAHKDLGFLLIKKVLDDLSDLDLVKSEPKIQEKSLICLIEPKK